MTSTSYGPGTAVPSGSQHSDDTALFRKLTWRIIPFLFLAFVVAYIDRVNVSFAKLQMLSDLSLTETVYGLGAGVFFIGYFLFEVPSNLILNKVGARLWIARIMVTWSIVSCLTMFATGPTSFYLLRFLLGVAEAGFFPGIMLYLSQWFPARRRSQIIALFMTAIPVSAAIGGPLSGWIMTSLAGTHGMAGWKWLFLIEGIGSMVVGIAAYFVLHDRIDSVRWLTHDEKVRLKHALQADTPPNLDHSVRGAFTNWRIWALGGLYFCIAMGNYGLSFWVPTIIKASGVASLANIGLLSAIPSLISVVAMITIARHSDRTAERRWHVAICCTVGAVGLLASVFFSANVPAAIISLVFAAIGINSIAPVFWGMSTSVMAGAGAAAAIAVINCTGNLAGFASPFIVGRLSDMTGSLIPGVFTISAALVLGAIIVVLLPSLQSAQPAQSALRHQTP